MSEFYAQIVKIDKIEKHPNADTLSIYTVLNDYPVIDKTDKFNLYDLVAYIPESAIVPDVEQFYFLSPVKYEKYLEGDEVKQRQAGKAYPVGCVPEKHRVIKSKSIRNFYSQGLLLPAPEGMKEGDSIVEYYGLSRVPEDNEENIVSCPKTRGRNAESPPKGWSPPYYDIDGLRKYSDCILPDEEIVIHEKLNGCVEFSSIIDTLEFGPIKIGEIYNNYVNNINYNIHIKSMNLISQEIEYQKCIEVFNNGLSNDWYEIESEDGEKLIITGNHLIWEPNLKCYRKVCDLEKDNNLLID